MRLLRFVASTLVHFGLLALAIDRIYVLHYQLPFDAYLPLHGLTNRVFGTLPGIVQPTTVFRHEVWWCVAIALVLISWAAGLSAFNVRPRPLRVKTPEGDSLLLDPGAIINFTKAQIDAHPAVTRHRVHVRQIGGKSVAITAHVKVIPMQSLPEIKRELERSIRDGFSQVLGIEKIDDITIVLGLDEKSLGRRPGPAGKDEPPEPVPPRGALEFGSTSPATTEVPYTPADPEI